MKLVDILKTVGSAVISTAVPGGPLLIAGVNAMLPDDKQLPSTVTGEQAMGVVDSLSPDQKALVLNKEFEVELTQIKESNATLRAMLQADAASTQTTRPKMALGSFYIVAAVTLSIAAGWLYAVYLSDDPLGGIVDGWPFVLALVAPFTTLMHAYFGVLKQEHKNRLDAGTGNSTPTGLAGIISALTKR